MIDVNEQRICTYYSYVSLWGDEINLLIEDDLITLSSYQDDLLHAINEAKRLLDSQIDLTQTLYRLQLINKKYTAKLTDENDKKITGCYLELKVTGVWKDELENIPNIDKAIETYKNVTQKLEGVK